MVELLELGAALPMYCPIAILDIVVMVIEATSAAVIEATSAAVVEAPVAIVAPAAAVVEAAPAGIVLLRAVHLHERVVVEIRMKTIASVALLLRLVGRPDA